MSDTVLVAFFATIAPTLLGIAAVISARKQGKKLDQVHQDTNGSLTKLLERNEQLADMIREQAKEISSLKSDAASE